MKLIFLGTGSAFTIGDNYQSNMILIHDNGKRLLIDCGSDARHSLHAIGLCYRDIDDVYISHPHADHAGGLEWLGFTHKFDESCQRPRLFTHESLVERLWKCTLSGGMRSIQEHNSQLETYFRPHPVKDDDLHFVWEGIHIELVPTIHVYHQDQLMPCYGVVITINGKKTYITADTQFTPDRLMSTYQKADMIFHDCETAHVASGVHPQFSDLATLPAELKNKMWLYHYNPGHLPDCLVEGFRGFVLPRQAFNLSDETTYRLR